MRPSTWVPDSLPATPKSPPTRRVPPRGTPRVPLVELCVEPAGLCGRCTGAKLFLLLDEILSPAETHFIPFARPLLSFRSIYKEPVLLMRVILKFLKLLSNETNQPSIHRMIKLMIQLVHSEGPWSQTPSTARTGSFLLQIGKSTRLNSSHKHRSRMPSSA